MIPTLHLNLSHVRELLHYVDVKITTGLLPLPRHSINLNQFVLVHMSPLPH